MVFDPGGIGTHVRHGIWPHTWQQQGCSSVSAAQAAPSGNACLEATRLRMQCMSSRRSNACLETTRSTDRCFEDPDKTAWVLAAAAVATGP